MGKFFKIAISFGTTRAALKKFKSMGGKLDRLDVGRELSGTGPRFELPNIVVMDRKVFKNHPFLKPRQSFLHEFGHSLDALKGKKRSRRRLARQATRDPNLSKPFQNAINIEYAANRQATKFIKKVSKNPEADLKHFTGPGEAGIKTYKDHFLMMKEYGKEMPKKLEDEAMEILPALSEVMSPKRMMKTKVDSFQPAALVADIKSVIRKKGPLTRKHRAKLYMKHKKLLHRDLTGLWKG